MDKVGLNIRKYGTSCILYDPIFKSKQYIRDALFKDPRAEKKQELPRFMFHPDNKCLIPWTIFGYILLIYTITFMPYGMLFYGDDPTIDLLENLMNGYFLADILVVFNTALLDHHSGL